jgi:prepilin-type N-terminal cleavage/methylation domain-containing protein
LQGGFTLVEILIALGVLAFGLVAVLGLMAAATTTHKKAVDRVNAALLADSIMADIDSALTVGFDETKLPVRESEGEEGGGEEEGPEAGPEPYEEEWPGAREEAGGGVVERATEMGPTYILKEGVESLNYPGYRYSVYLTAVGRAPAPAFFVEVVVAWSEKGREITETYQTLLLRRVRRSDLVE